MNFSKLSDDALISCISDAAIEEREQLLRQLFCLVEFEKRKLTLQYPSLWHFLTEELGMEESSALRRIKAARLLSQFPELASRLESGKLNLSLLDLAGGFFKGKDLDAREKWEILESLEGKSCRAARRWLCSKSPDEVTIPRDQVREITEDLSQVSFVASNELLEKIEKIRGLLTHADPEAGLGALFLRLAKEYLERHHPEEKLKRAEARKQKPEAAPRRATSPYSEESRKPTQAMMRELIKRDGYRCSYIYPKNGKSCRSESGLQVDHVIPWALDGKTEHSNLRILCKNHNARAAVLRFGVKKMAAAQKRGASD